MQQPNQQKLPRSFSHNKFRSIKQDHLYIAYSFQSKVMLLFPKDES